MSDTDKHETADDTVNDNAYEPTQPDQQTRKESTVAQGTKFELRVARLLAARGYKVQHNVSLPGQKTGTLHQIDVLAEHQGPLHKDILVVECKAYNKGHNLEKEILMKQMGICRDLGYGGVMIFTTSSFMTGLHMTAKQYSNLTLIDGEKFASLERDAKLNDKSKSPSISSYVKPIISKTKALKHAKSRAKKMSGGLFNRRPKVAVKSVMLVCYPYHTVRYHHEKIEKKGMFRKVEITRKIPHEVSVDARIGTVMDVKKGKGVSYHLDFIKDLKPDEITLLCYANKKKMITGTEIKLSGVSKDSASECLPRMHGLGYVSRLSMNNVESWKSNKIISSDIKSIPQIYKKYMVEEPPGIRVDPLVQPGPAIQSVKWLGDKVDSMNTIYYPYYDIRYEDDQDTQYNEMLDAITGKETINLRDTMSEWRPRDTFVDTDNDTADTKDTNDTDTVNTDTVNADTVNADTGNADTANTDTDNISNTDDTDVSNEDVEDVMRAGIESDSSAGDDNSPDGSRTDSGYNTADDKSDTDPVTDNDDVDIQPDESKTELSNDVDEKNTNATSKEDDHADDKSVNNDDGTDNDNTNADAVNDDITYLDIRCKRTWSDCNI